MQEILGYLSVEFGRKIQISGSEAIITLKIRAIWTFPNQSR
jgi:hypothetical protein